MSWLILMHNTYKCDSLCLPVIPSHLAAPGPPARTQTVEVVMCLSAVCFRSDVSQTYLAANFPWRPTGTLKEKKLQQMDFRIIGFSVRISHKNSNPF